MNAELRQEKTCERCGRRITWRKKWARTWGSIRYCSERCRGRRQLPADRELEAAILTLLVERPVHSSICPSEAARRVAGDGDWQALMEPAREAARRLVARGQIEMTQRGVGVDPSRARGPVRLRRTVR
ncbi:MAG: hypothetical protein K0R38_4646 [Polyangiaceae bacterium]|jgi:hypothetical protein|nr:hypothetical protein [Polyangiaceae bacterium]